MNSSLRKPEVIIPICLSVFTVIGSTGGAIWAGVNARSTEQSNESVYKALNNAAMVKLQDDITAIRSSVSSVPNLSFDVAQLKAWKEEQKGFNGSIDGRLHIVEATANEAKTKVEAIFAASGLNPEGRKMR